MRNLRESGFSTRAFAAASAMGAAAIHFSVTGDHFKEYWLFGWFFVALAWSQVAWALWVMWRPSKLAFNLGALGSLAVVALWVASRTSGVPLGPTPWHPEAVGIPDTTSTALELATAGVCLLASLGWTRRRRSDGLRALLALALAGLVVPLTTVALAVSAGGQMKMSPAMAGSAPGSTSPMPAMPGSTPSSPCPNLPGVMPMADGMIMQPTPMGAPTAAQQAAAGQLVAQTRAGAAQYTLLSSAQAAGYVPATNPKGRVVHWVNWGYTKDGLILDPQKPEELIYANTVKGPVLVGVMYLSGGRCVPGPDVAGPLTVWHAHANLCFASNGEVVGKTNSQGQCAQGRFVGPSAFMLHVWLAPSLGDPLQPEVPFSAFASIIRTGQP